LEVNHSFLVGVVFVLDAVFILPAKQNECVETPAGVSHVVDNIAANVSEASFLSRWTKRCRTDSGDSLFRLRENRPALHK